MTDRHKNKQVNKIQFIINDGIVYNKRDMLMLLRDLGHVVYFEFSNGKPAARGKGYIMRVSANLEEPTLFLAGRIYINVNVFDYIKLAKVKGQEKTLFELHSASRTIRLLPDDNPRNQPPMSQSLFADKLMELGIVAEDPWDEDDGGLGEGLRGK